MEHCRIFLVLFGCRGTLRARAKTFMVQESHDLNHLEFTKLFKHFREEINCRQNVMESFICRSVSETLIVSSTHLF